VFAADPPAVRIRAPEDFPLGLTAVEEPVISLDYLRAAAAKPPAGNLDLKYLTGPTATIYRWTWLSDKRRNIDHYDRLARKAAALEAEFWREYGKADHPQKDAYKRHGDEYRDFLNMRITWREGWYYTAVMHHFRWEKDRPGGSHLYRFQQAVCKAVGCRRDDLNRFLAWADLLAGDLLPKHMSLWLTVPLALLS
jgi:hypothetical protein